MRCVAALSVVCNHIASFVCNLTASWTPRPNWDLGFAEVRCLPTASSLHPHCPHTVISMHFHCIVAAPSLRSLPICDATFSPPECSWLGSQRLDAFSLPTHRQLTAYSLSSLCPLAAFFEMRLFSPFRCVLAAFSLPSHCLHTATLLSFAAQEHINRNSYVEGTRPGGRSWVLCLTPALPPSLHAYRCLKSCVAPLL